MIIPRLGARMAHRAATLPMAVPAGAEVGDCEGPEEPGGDDPGEGGGGPRLPRARLR